MADTAVDDRTGYTSLQVMNKHKGGYAWDAVILHHTASKNEEGDFRWLSQPHDNPVSCHKLFRRRKGIIKIVPENYEAWAAGRSRLHGRENLNAFALQYEICNDGIGETYTDEQYDAVAASLAYDLALYKIPDKWVSSHRQVRNNWITAHPQQAKLPPRQTWDMKTDPKGWDWGRMWARVDEIRGNWPSTWRITLWYDDSGPRQMRT
jgi:N-acetyl-anhydromuramyl-L-alanine amidase AmpD